MALLRLNLRLKSQVPVAKFCSSDVTAGAQMPVGDVMEQFPWKRKETERLVLFVSGRTKTRDVLTREGGLLSHPEFI